MKVILPLILLCLGCTSSPAPVEPKAPSCPELPKPVVTVSDCTDQVILLDADALAKGFSCPNNSRTTFPSYFGSNAKVLVLCQCR